MTPVPTIATFLTSRLLAISSSSKFTSFNRLFVPRLLTGSERLFHVFDWLWTWNRTTSTQAVDFVIAKTELLQDFIVVFANSRGAPRRHLQNTVYLNRTVDGRSQILASSFEWDDDVIRTQLRILDDFLRFTHGAE